MIKQETKTRNFFVTKELCSQGEMFLVRRAIILKELFKL